ncbi:MAG: hypothetical protein IKY02_05900, partial [Lachnospiraceae bacterium]|nr:hypothetical protein [Lachnospiraceae bacterium]
MGFKIRELPSEARPYEKCLMAGAGALEDAELLAVILRTGTRNVNSVELARRVLARSNGSLAGLYEQSVPDFRKIPGIGRVKAVQLECLKELSARVVKSVSPAKTDFTSAEEIFHR